MYQILIIDDEATIRSMLRRLLERLGYSVLEAPDGEVGLEVCHQHTPDLVITDLAMPKKGGLETIMELTTRLLSGEDHRHVRWGYGLDQKFSTS